LAEFTNEERPQRFVNSATLGADASAIELDGSPMRG
jgi:hypothetical protein